MPNEVKLGITAEDTGLVAGLAEAEASIKEFAATAAESVEGLSAAIEKINVAFVALTGVLAGGKAFGEAIKTTVDLNVQSAALGKQFGISATQASILKDALDATHVTQDQFSAAGNRILKTLNTNEGAFKSLGVATRDASGNLRPLADITIDTNTALLRFKEGTDRGVEATKIYGKGWAEVAPTLRVTKAAMAEAAITANELGLVATKQSEAMTGAYRDAMVGVGKTLEGIGNAIGQAVIPALTELGTWFRSVGPEVIHGFHVALDGLKVIFGAVGDSVKALWNAFGDFVNIFRDGIAKAFGDEPIGKMEFFMNVLKVVEVAFIGLRTGVQAVLEVIAGQFQYLDDLATGWANVIERAFHLDWAGVQAAWKAGNDKIEADEQAHFQKLVAISTKGADDMNNAVMATLGQRSKGDPTDAPGGTKGSTGGAKDKQLAEFQKELDLEYAALEKHHKAEMLVYQAQEQEFAKNAAARVAIAEEEVAAEARTFGKGSPQYEAAQKHLVEVKRQAAEQSAQIAATFDKLETQRQLAAIADDEKNLQAKYQHHEINNAQLEAGELQLENRRTAIAEAGIRARRALIDPDKDPVQAATLDAQLLAQESAHQQKITEIKEQAAQRDRAVWDQTSKAIQSSFQSSLAGMMQGTTTMSKGFQNLWTGTTKAITNSFAQMVTQNIAHLVEQAVASKEISMKEIMANAAKAGSAAFNAVAGIPYVGPFLAPAAAAAAFAGAMAFGSEVSAAGGYDVPNVAPIAQLHPREMVLPESLAERVRAMTAQPAGATAGSGAGPTIKFNAHDMGGGFFMSHVDEFASTFKQAVRNGKLQMPR